MPIAPCSEQRWNILCKFGAVGSSISDRTNTYRSHNRRRLELEAAITPPGQPLITDSEAAGNFQRPTNDSGGSRGVSHVVSSVLPFKIGVISKSFYTRLSFTRQHVLLLSRLTCRIRRGPKCNLTMQ
ncbi:hypothetical protein J6590_075076 [Homalodisca vitripennis]|nr:hypothetical protein J6590_075076 [Homalodisca vitripennis]